MSIKTILGVGAGLVAITGATVYTYKRSIAKETDISNHKFDINIANSIIEKHLTKDLDEINSLDDLEEVRQCIKKIKILSSKLRKKEGAGVVAGGLDKFVNEYEDKLLKLEWKVDPLEDELEEITKSESTKKSNSQVDKFEEKLSKKTTKGKKSKKDKKAKKDDYSEVVIEKEKSDLLEDVNLDEENLTDLGSALADAIRNSKN